MGPINPWLCPSPIHHRIIEPLTSRCSKFRFKPLAVEVLKARLEHIASQENLKTSPQASPVISLWELGRRELLTVYMPGDKFVRTYMYMYNVLVYTVAWQCAYVLFV